MRQKSIIYIFSFFCISLCTTSLVFAQQSDREAVEERIRQTRIVLDQTEKEKINSMDELSAIKGQIAQRKELLRTLEDEQVSIEREIGKVQGQIDTLELDIIALKDEYSEMIYVAYKTNQSYQKLAYLFSSETLGQLVTRANFLEQYKEARKKQINAITKKMDMLVAKNDELNQRKEEEQILIQEEKKQVVQLQSLEKDKESVIVDLKSKSQSIRRQLAKEKEAFARVDAAVKRVVNKTSKTNLANSSTKKKSFHQLKGKLSWPVKDGFVTNKFGKQEHPVLEGIMIDALGVDIRTTDNAPVTVVFDGVIQAVTKVPDMNYVVVVSHDNDYSTVYARLDNIQVRIGQKVKTHQVIGTVPPNENGISELQFQIWKMPTQKVNPEEWLKQ